MTPFPRDLFGEVIVTRDDIERWMIHVPRINPDGPRAAAYIRNYSVPEKIARAKLEGRFEALCTPQLPEPQSAVWWHRMCWF